MTARAAQSSFAGRLGRRTLPGRVTARALAASAIVAAVGLASPSAPAAPLQKAPSFVRGPIHHARYDGVADDLLTAGLGKTGLASPVPPGFADPLQPTAAELRRLAIYTNYRALVDPTPGGGFGVLYGPNIDLNGVDTLGEGRIPGDEYLAFADDGSGRQNVTMMVQVPASFKRRKACIVTAPSSGSRGVYGAIATAGEWGLKRGCAVAYTDKGTGTGAHDLQGNTVNLIRGERKDADEAGDASNFTALLSEPARDQFNAATPNRFAFKHAHSQQNPERDWGRDVLRSIEFAFFVLNEQFRGGIRPGNTLVIASSVSNGGGASIRAAEQDGKGLIDAVVVSEPNVNPRFDPRFTIVQEGRAPVVRHSRPLLDYTTLVNVFQGCASANPDLATAGAPLNLAPSAARCTALHEKGLLQADNPADQAREAQQVINEAGILPEQNLVQPSHWFAFVPQSISVTYANAYGHFNVARNLCGYSFGATDAAGLPTGLAPASLAQLFSVSNGIPPTGGVNLINNLAPGGPKHDRLSTPEQNLEGALCLRALATGRDPVTGRALTGAARLQHDWIAFGVRQILASGDLHGVPTLIVTGRSDAILPPNHTSRAYFGLNRLVERGRSRLRYYEVTNAQHLDAFNAFPGFNSRFIPLHHYFIQAMNLMYTHLETGAPLPPSQLVRTTPRAVASDGAVSPITLSNLPAIAADPDADARITFVDREVRIPN